MNKDAVLHVIADTAVAEELIPIAEGILKQGIMTAEDVAETLAGFITFRVEG